MNKTYKIILAFTIIAVWFFACKPDDTDDTTTTPYIVDLSDGVLPQAQFPADNPLTVEGVELGRRLFYENKLSGDNTMSCGSCHLQSNAFTDTARFSLGIHGLEGRRNSMAIFNVVYHNQGMFWDGRVESVRAQALMPIQDELELDETLENVVSKLEADEDYPTLFKNAFGSTEITPEKIGLAIEQFEMTMISKNSKYDQFVAGNTTLTEQEERGRQLFFKENLPNDPINSGADCFHCHGGALFTNNKFINNGLDADFLGDADKGLFEFTESSLDLGKFKVPSLRNIELTAPYMHDGRFQTLEEVVEHYDNGAVHSPNLDPNMLAFVEEGLNLSDDDKAALVAFLKTLTDNDFINNPEFSNPFE